MAKGEKPATVLATASAVMEAIHLRFPKQEYAVFGDVADATGFRGRRRADALIMSLWPSRGLHLHGVEIKVSRSDVLRELRDPAKAEAIASYCDFWWLAVGDERIVKLEEVPKAWGLLVPSPTGMRCAKDATALKPKPLSREFLAAVMRAAAEHLGDAALRRNIRQEIYEEVRKSAADAEAHASARKVEGLTERLDAATKRADTAEAALRAIKGTAFAPAVVSDAVALLTKLRGWRGAVQSTRASIDRITSAVEDMTRVTATLEDVAALLGKIESGEG